MCGLPFLARILAYVPTPDDALCQFYDNKGNPYLDTLFTSAREAPLSGVVR